MPQPERHTDTACLGVFCCNLLQVETIRSNVIGCLNLADVTNQKGIHMTYYGTGCIFHYDDEFPQGSGKGFKESDKPNFTGSYYSYTKVRRSWDAGGLSHAGSLGVAVGSNSRCGSWHAGHSRYGCNSRPRSARAGTMKVC